ncbi:MAG: XTP/dITP diphosphohydrolase [Patescibacteria group bacterium]|nr:XTP/dITP diphosphohydrolase [Patescibacteria group bacterium]
MKEIIFATGNKGKVFSLQKYANKFDLDLAITQQFLDLIEPQADTSSEVAKSKARQAYKVFNKPVLADDSSFHISTLGGFPGPYIKYMITTLGINGILSFMEDKSDRSAYFLSSLVLIDEYGRDHLFEDEPYWGTIATEIDDFKSEKSWSELHKIFIPNGSDKVLARMIEFEREKVNIRTNSYEKLCLWLKDNPQMLKDSL